MSTPAMVAASMLKIMVLCIGVFWIVSFSVGRIFVFYETYTETMRLLKDETWLRVQCADPSFYSNIRQHADLCTGVQRNFERGAILVALNAVANTAHLCGRHSCADAVIYVSRGGWPVMVTVGVVCLFAPLLLSKLTRLLVTNHHDDGGYKSQLPYSKMA